MACGAAEANAMASAPEPVPTSATRAGLLSIKPSAASTSCSLAARGVIT
jgi:hypothetical protein